MLTLAWVLSAKMQKEEANSERRCPIEGELAVYKGNSGWIAMEARDLLSLERKLYSPNLAIPGSFKKKSLLQIQFTHFIVLNAPKILFFYRFRFLFVGQKFIS